MADILLVSVMAYIATNIDDMFINMLLFSSSKSQRDDFCIVVGKYLGTGFLVAVSLLGGYGLQVLVGKYIKLLGIIPLFLGIKQIFDKGQQENLTSALSKGFVLSTAAITIASGADNIGVYVPLFAGFSLAQATVMVSVFTVMTAVWCFVGKKLTVLPAIRKIIEKYRGIISPVVYICLGLYILLF